MVERVDVTYVVNTKGYLLHWGSGESYQSRDLGKPKQVLAFLKEHPGFVLAKDGTINVSRGKGKVERNKSKLKKVVPAEYFGNLE